VPVTSRKSNIRYFSAETSAVKTTQDDLETKIQTKFEEMARLFEQSNFTQAIQVAESILKIDPNNLHALYNIGSAYEASEQYEKAFDVYAKLTETEAAINALQAMQRIRFMTGNHNEAIEYGKRILYLSDGVNNLPDELMVVVEILLQSWAQLGDDPALHNFVQTNRGLLNKKMNMPPSYVIIANVLHELKRFDDERNYILENELHTHAEQEVQAAMSKKLKILQNCNYADISRIDQIEEELYQLQEKPGNDEKRIELCQEFIQLAPMISVGYYNLAVMVLETGDKERAVAVARKGISIDEDATLYFVLIEALAMMGKKDEIVQTLATLKEKYPNDANAKNVIQQVESNLHKLD
jgi:tetratricopeptide (TPR) repeat protein